MVWSEDFWLKTIYLKMSKQIKTFLEGSLGFVDHINDNKYDHDKDNHKEDNNNKDNQNIENHNKDNHYQDNGNKDPLIIIFFYWCHYLHTLRC